MIFLLLVTWCSLVHVLSFAYFIVPVATFTALDQSPFNHMTILDTCRYKAAILFQRKSYLWEVDFEHECWYHTTAFISYYLVRFYFSTLELKCTKCLGMCIIYIGVYYIYIEYVHSLYNSYDTIIMRFICIYTYVYIHNIFHIHA